MQHGKFNVLLDGQHGSSGKAKMSCYLADKYSITHVSSSNMPNAGHSVVYNELDIKFISKAIPTPLILKRVKGINMTGWLSPASGLTVNNEHKLDRLYKEWIETGKPKIYIHARASIVTPEHAERERSGLGSTKHIASTMQGCSAAMVDKILRLKDCLLIGSKTIGEWLNKNDELYDEFIEKIVILDGPDFRSGIHELLNSGNTIFHEISQGHALSIDHGSHFPACTSRNCTTQKALDDMAIPPQMTGDIYMNLRTFPIRVGNVFNDDGSVLGYSGDFYPDSKEMTWDEIGRNAGMPEEEIQNLAQKNLTTVTKRVRRVSTFSMVGLKDAAVTNGVTKICLNFVQYLNWKDNGLKEFCKLSTESRKFITKIEESVNIPVVLIGTGADNYDVIDLL